MLISAQILIATDMVADAESVKRLLKSEFENVFISVNPEHAVSDFEHYRPNVLILAFTHLADAERYYLGLYRLSTLMMSVAHRTIVLCDTKELQRVYELCRIAYFDDYALFWPMTNDTQRLPMAVTHALRDLGRSKCGVPAAEMARQVRRMAELEGLLERQLDQGETNAVRMQQEISKLTANDGGQQCRTLGDAVQPLGQWIDDLKQQLAPHRQSLATLQTLAQHFRPLVLMVDDEEFQCILAEELLREAPYELIFASNGAQGLSVLRDRRPALILMDMMMPEMSGLETLCRLKASDLLADIPVMMVTGQSDKALVVECLKAGAVDFVVKPLERDVLLKKVARFLAK